MPAYLVVYVLQSTVPVLVLVQTQAGARTKQRSHAKFWGE